MNVERTTQKGTEKEREEDIKSKKNPQEYLSS
jgi:hypothetical protein